MGILTTGTASEEEKEKFSPLSKFMALVEYDEKNRTMDVTFHSGSKTRYIMVYPNTFLSFKQSPTHDAYYSRAIKGNLQSIKIIDKNLGRVKSSPLKTVTKEQPLDRGLRQHLAARKRAAGTVPASLIAA